MRVRTREQKLERKIRQWRQQLADPEINEIVEILRVRSDGFGLTARQQAQLSRMPKLIPKLVKFKKSEIYINANLNTSNLSARPAKTTVASLQSAPSEGDISAFYESWDWKRLRYRALQRFGRKCLSCNAKAAEGTKIVVDHIKPIRHYWHLRLDADNVQPLCDDCNMGKGSWDETDFRAIV